MQAVTIERAIHNKEHPYTIIAKSFCEDMSISMELKALLLYCFSRKDNWCYHVTHLAKVHKIGYRKCLRLLDEGIKSGYISREKVKENNLNCGIRYFFSENKSFSKNVTDVTESNISEEILEKYKNLERKSHNSKNVTDVSDFRHAENDKLVITDNGINTDRNRLTSENDPKPVKTKRPIPEELKIPELNERDQQLITNQFADNLINLALDDARRFSADGEFINNPAAYLTFRCKKHKEKQKK